MSVHLLVDAPTFNAISYTWGEDGHSAYIIVDDRQISVTPNCQYALWQAQLNSSSTAVWIDSVCINQDDPVEKGVQVAMMSKLFSEAQHVLACVGPHDETSRGLGELCDNVGYLLDLHHDAPHPRSVALALCNFNDAEDCIYLRDVPDSCTLDKALELLHVFRAFEGRRYWKRLWVVQELCAAGASNIKVLYGDSVLEWDLISNINGFFRHFNILMLKDSESVREECSSVQDLALLVARAFDKSIPLSTLIALTKRMQCANPHDKIYSVLGLIKLPGAAPSMEPSYDQDLFATATSVIPACGQGLNYLSQLFQCMWTACTHDSLRKCRSSQGKSQSLPDCPTEVLHWRVGFVKIASVLSVSQQGQLCTSHPHNEKYNGSGPHELEVLPGCNHDGTPKMVWTGSTISAVVSSNARAGDVIMAAEDACAWVVRRAGDRGLELVGQAVLLHEYGPPWECRNEVKEDLVHRLNFKGALTIPLTIREAIMLSIAYIHDNKTVPTPFAIETSNESRMITIEGTEDRGELEKLIEFAEKSASQACID